MPETRRKAKLEDPFNVMPMTMRNVIADLRIIQANTNRLIAKIKKQMRKRRNGDARDTE